MHRHLIKLKADKRARYIFVGGSSFVVEYSLFVALDMLGANIFVSNSVSFVVALVISFLLHRNWSFKGNHRFGQKHQAAGYMSLALINLALTNVVIGLLTAVLVPSFVAKILTMAAMVSWNYLILNKLIFREHKTNGDA